MWIGWLYFSMCTAGVPERVGQKDWQRAGCEALGPWAYWEQPRWLVLGQSSDARAEHALGDGLQPLCVQTDTTWAGSLSGETCYAARCYTRDLKTWHITNTRISEEETHLHFFCELILMWTKLLFMKVTVYFIVKWTPKHRVLEDFEMLIYSH